MSRPSEHHGAPVARATTADEERVGSVIDGRYRLDALIGKGGMGLVYRAEHVAIRRVVALKLLHASLAQVPELRSRFEREARAIGVISHPNCVDVTDFGELADGSLYLAMEYVDGKSLGDILDRDHSLDPRRALRILRHVLSGLGHAHQAGIVHRDIKPENVLLTEVNGDRDFAKILDFGIAKLIAKTVDDGVKLTQAGVAFGTPVYMSPEQALGNPVDRRADLYAASVMAYEMICGRPPFYSDDKLEVLSMHTARPVPPMDETRRATLGAKLERLPSGVERVILKGMAKQPRERWQNAEEYIVGIDEVLVGLSIEDPAPEVGASTGARPLVDAIGRSLIHDRIRRESDDSAGPMITPTALSTIAPPDGPMYTPTSQATVPAPTGTEPVLLTRPAAAPVTAAVKRKPPLLLLAAGAGLFVVLGLIMFVLATGGGDETQRPKSAAAREAADRLEKGDAAGAIKGLEAKKDEIAGDAEAQLQLGRAHSARREHAPALLAFQRALDLDPKLERDKSLRASLWSITREDDMAAAMAAYDLLVNKTKDPDAKSHLLADAVGVDEDRRHAADALLERLGMGAEIDWLQVYLLDLEQGDSCTLRKQAVAKLRVLGDARAIPGLEAAIDRKGKTGKWKGKPVNNCLAEDARAAVAYLSQLTGVRVDAAP